MNAFELVAKITLNKDEYDRGLEDAAKRTGTTADKITKAQKAIGGMALAGVAAIGAFGAASIKTGMQFDSSMSQVAATMGTTVENIQNLREYAKEMGATTAFSATQAADAMNYMALAGYDAETTMKMLPNVLNLAAAGSMELAAASDMITDSQSALGLTLEQTTELVDKMAKAASKSNTSVSQLGEAILTVGGTAKNLSGGTTELATALGILADNGIKGSEGGTALRNVILSLSAPTDKASQLMKQLGLEIYDAEGNMRPLSAIFGDLNAQLETMSQEERTNVLSELFNKVDLKSANALLGTNAERWRELSGAIDDASGAAEQMANTQLDNLAGDITLLKSAFEGLQISVSDKLTPAARIAVQSLTSLVENAGSVASAILPAAVAFGVFAVAINITSIVTSVATSVKALWGVILANPIGLAIALFAGLAVATYNLITHFAELYTEADKAAEGIRNLNRATEASTSSWVDAQNGAEAGMDGIESAVEAGTADITSAMESGGQEAGAAYTESLVSALDGIDPQLAAQIQAAMSNGANIAESYGSQFGNAGGEAVGEYAGAWQSGTGQIDGAVSGAVDGAMVSAQNAGMDGAVMFGQVGTSMVTRTVSSIAASAQAVSSAARGVVVTAFTVANAATSMFTAVGQNIARGIAAGISAGSGAIAAAARSAVQSAVAAAKAAAGIASPSKLFRDEVGVFIGLGVAEGIEDSTDEAVKAAKELAEKTYSKSKEWLRRQTKFNKLTLIEQLEVWQEIQSQYIKESKQWIEAEEEIFDLREKIQENFADNTKKLWENIADAQEKYDDKLEARIEKIADAYDLFDDVQDREAVNASELTSNLQRQVNVLGNFYDELDQLSARGVSDELVGEIRDMGPKAIDNLEALLSMTDDQLSKYAELYGEKQRIANDTAVKELAGLKEETEQTIRENVKSLVELYNENGPTIGKALTTGITEGIKRGMSDVMDAAIDVAENTVNAIRGQLGFDVFGAITKSGSSKVDFASSGMGISSAGIINSVSQQRIPDQKYTINLQMADGSVMAKWIFDPLKNYANAKGQPIVNPA